MINLLCLLCSLCIQFVAIDLPYNFSTVNTNNYATVTTLWEDLVGRGYNVDPDYMIVVYRPNQTRLYYVYYPNEPFNQQQSSISLSNRIESTGTINVTMTNWRRFTFTNLNTYYNMTENSSLGSSTFQLDDGSSWGSSTNIIIWNARYSLPYDNLDTFNWQNEVSPVLPPSGSGIGSLSGSGHSSSIGGLEELETSGVTWTSLSGHSSGTLPPSPHSQSTHFNVTPGAPDNNDSKTDTLLYMIGDKLADITENTSAIISGLGGVMSNQIQSASAIFNGISVFNDNFIKQTVYDQDKVDATLENSSMMLFASTTTDLTETIINESDVLLDAVHDMEEKQDLILYLDLTKWKVPVYSSSTGVNTSYVRPYNEVVQIDFTFLKETKSIWQPILLGVLYLALFMSIYFDLPNILRGANA